ncbi:MAG: hypothetical protein NTY03_01080, partial [Candidatus Bathyarchaeota archaeon]|nr:hypothetical protein [Candidatus Bathyarchaeota archaeon]
SLSIKGGLNVHSYVGGKYGELWMASHLQAHEPLLASSRRKNVGVKNPSSCDIVLTDQKKKLEVKWGVYHGPKDPMTNGCNNIPYWGWGFSMGKQLEPGKFDYCILLAAEPDGAKTSEVFVLKQEEMTPDKIGGKRKSVVNSGSFYVEYSKNPLFYGPKKWGNGKKSYVETLLQDEALHNKRWKQLVDYGKLVED